MEYFDPTNHPGNDPTNPYNAMPDANVARSHVQSSFALLEVYNKQVEDIAELTADKKRHEASEQQALAAADDWKSKYNLVVAELDEFKDSHKKSMDEKDLERLNALEDLANDHKEALSRQSSDHTRALRRQEVEHGKALKSKDLELNKVKSDLVEMTEDAKHYETVCQVVGSAITSLMSVDPDLALTALDGNPRFLSDFIVASIANDPRAMSPETSMLETAYGAIAPGGLGKSYDEMQVTLHDRNKNCNYVARHRLGKEYDMGKGMTAEEYEEKLAQIKVPSALPPKIGAELSKQDRKGAKVLAKRMIKASMKEKRRLKEQGSSSSSKKRRSIFKSTLPSRRKLSASDGKVVTSSDDSIMDYSSSSDEDSE